MKRVLLAVAMMTAVCGAQTLPSSNNIVVVDGVAYPFTGAGVQAAINAACTGSVPGKVVLPPTTISKISTKILINSSNCTIEGAGSAASILDRKSVV